MTLIINNDDVAKLLTVDTTWCLGKRPAGLE
jgi:hypothetical protein